MRSRCIHESVNGTQMTREQREGKLETRLDKKRLVSVERKKEVYLIHIANSNTSNILREKITEIFIVSTIDLAC